MTNAERPFQAGGSTANRTPRTRARHAVEGRISSASQRLESIAPDRSLSIGIYRYGEGRPLRGLCIGVTRHPPRGIRRDRWSELGLCDVWLPLLAPSRELVAAYRGNHIDYTTFAAHYRREMARPEARHLIALLAGVARGQIIHLGCVCADPSRCHRSILRDLVARAQALAHVRRGFSSAASAEPGECSSPPCSMPEIED